MGSRPVLCAHNRLASVVSLCPLEVARKRRIRAIRPTSMRSQDLRGRMRRPGASCTATKTQALSEHVPPQEYRKIRAGRRQRLRTSVVTANIHVAEAGGSGLHSDIGNLGCLPAGYGLRTPYPPTQTPRFRYNKGVSASSDRSVQRSTNRGIGSFRWSNCELARSN